MIILKKKFINFINFIIIEMNMILNKLNKELKQILIQIYLINLFQNINKIKQKKLQIINKFHNKNNKQILDKIINNYI